ncbi:putative toxin-antitoxin system toxin component, PIN family [Spirosoma sp. KNUC1025]|uniref:PIN domain-containing protein n=1 Tax=Spirosoma sp. KNUC1025 TaxID=2894082 RepID=UPI00386A4399|nr:PIN domain-containing protein [Spirosoma sp. KNUC1025]
MIVIIDTNCLLVSLPRRAETRWLFDALLTSTFQLGIPNEILEEYEEIIGNFFTPEVGANVVKALIDRPNAIHVTPYYKWQLIKSDTDDNKFVDCALACGADYIITEDHHFNELDKVPFPKIVHVGLAEFKRILRVQVQ